MTKEVKRGRKPLEHEVSALNVKIERILHDDVRRYSEVSGISLRGVVEKALRVFLKSQEDKE